MTMSTSSTAAADNTAPTVNQLPVPLWIRILLADARDVPKILSYPPNGSVRAPHPPLLRHRVVPNLHPFPLPHSGPSPSSSSSSPPNLSSEAYRTRDLGKMLMSAVAGQAARMGLGRVEWCVLDWNMNAMEFYNKIGAEVLQEWQICWLSGDALSSYGPEEQDAHRELIDLVHEELSLADQISKLKEWQKAFFPGILH